MARRWSPEEEKLQRQMRAGAAPSWRFLDRTAAAEREKACREGLTDPKRPWTTKEQDLARHWLNLLARALGRSTTSVAAKVARLAKESDGGGIPK